MRYDIEAIRRDNDLLEVASRYVDVRKEGREYKSLCIFHADSGTPNLTFFRGKDGRQRFQCFACGEGGDVIDFVEQAEGIDTKEALKKLAGGDLPVTGTYKPPAHRMVDLSDEWQCVLPVPAHAPEFSPTRVFNPKAGEWKRYRPTRIDPYRAADGQLLCYVIRLEFDDAATKKRKKVCMTVTWCRDQSGDERWCVKRLDPPYPLQGLDDLAAKPKAVVMVHEGEKARDAALKAWPRFAHATFMGGVEGLKYADVSPLRGRELVVFPDADNPGVNAMMQLIRMVRR